MKKMILVEVSSIIWLIDTSSVGFEEDEQLTSGEQSSSEALEHIAATLVLSISRDLAFEKDRQIAFPHHS